MERRIADNGTWRRDFDGTPESSGLVNKALEASAGWDAPGGG